MHALSTVLVGQLSPGWAALLWLLIVVAAVLVWRMLRTEDRRRAERIDQIDQRLGDVESYLFEEGDEDE